MQASPYWEIATGYVGAMRAEIPFTSLYSQAVRLTLDETLITIRPRSTPLQDDVHGSVDGSRACTPGTPPALPNLSKYPKSGSHNPVNNAILSCLAAGQSMLFIGTAPDALLERKDRCGTWWQCQ